MDRPKLVLRYREKPGQPDDGWRVTIQVFVGSGHQTEPDDITAGLAGELRMTREEWGILRAHVADDLPTDPVYISLARP